jgi:HK97 family phage prohead protease
MSVTLNKTGKSHANALVMSGKVDRDSKWTIVEESTLANDEKLFFGVDAETKSFSHPFGKDGKVYRSALIAIRQQDGQNAEIFAAAGALLEKIDGKKEGDSMKKEIERRTFNMEFRAINEKDKPEIKGVAAIFNSLSENLGDFREQIVPGAFKEALVNADVRALFNHDPNMILGRTTSKTLRLTETDQGLEYECDMPDTSYARDLMACMQRGDINQCSFGFSVADGGAEFKKDSTGQWIRTINKVARLYDVSPVTYPAYPETTVAMRSLDKIKAEEIPPFDDTEIRKMRFEMEAVL